MRTVRLEEIATILPSESTSSDGDTEVSVATSGCLTPAGFDPAGIRRNRIGAAAAERAIVRPGDVLVARSNTADSVGRAATYEGIPRPLCVSDLVLRIRPGDDVDSRYLGWYLAALQITGYWRTRANGASSTMVKIRRAQLHTLPVPLPPLVEQRQVVALLAARIRTAVELQAAITRRFSALSSTSESLLSASLAVPTSRVTLGASTAEVRTGVGRDWATYKLVGASRSGLSAAKESVGKHPERYKPAMPGTIFYNPMRILIGSIAHVDDIDPPSITSPDYVVFTCRDEVIDHTWLYHWLRSWRGQALIKAHARGAVRERLLYARLAPATIDIPHIQVQRRTARLLRRIEGTTTVLDRQLDSTELLATALVRSAF